MNDDFPLKNKCSSDIGIFVRQIDSFIYDSNMQIARGKLLAQIVAARKTIVGHRPSLSPVLVADLTADSPASSKSSYRKDGRPHYEHAARLHDSTHNRHDDLSLPSRNICIG